MPIQMQQCGGKQLKNRSKSIQHSEFSAKNVNPTNYVTLAMGIQDLKKLIVLRNIPVIKEE